MWRPNCTKQGWIVQTSIISHVQQTSLLTGKLRPCSQTLSSGTSATLAGSIATSTYTKLVPRCLGPSRVVAVQSHYLLIDRHETHNTISTRQAKLARNTTTRTLTSVSDRHQLTCWRVYKNAHYTQDDFKRKIVRRVEIDENPCNAIEEQIFRHTGRINKSIYAVRWYEYNLIYDKVKPLGQITQQFIAFYG